MVVGQAFPPYLGVCKAYLNLVCSGTVCFAVKIFYTRFLNWYAKKMTSYNIMGDS